MSPRSLLSVSLVLGALAMPATAQSVGGGLPPKVELEDFGLTPAKSYDDFMGRAVLIEFFAYW